MNESSMPGNVVAVDTTVPVWEQFFTVAPLVLIGTREEDGSLDLAPKHMVTPMGWQNHFGFVCTPSHSTCTNIERTGEFTVSYPKPSQVLVASLAASPRDAENHKPVLDFFRTFPAREIDGCFIDHDYLQVVLLGLFWIRVGPRGQAIDEAAGVFDSREARSPEVDGELLSVLDCFVAYLFFIPRQKESGALECVENLFLTLRKMGCFRARVRACFICFLICFYCLLRVPQWQG